MSAELIGILSVGVAVAALILTRMHAIRAEMREHREEMRTELRYLRDKQERLQENTDDGFRCGKGRVPSEYRRLARRIARPLQGVAGRCPLHHRSAFFGGLRNRCGRR